MTRLKFAVFMLAFFVIGASYAQIYLGTVEGYIKDFNGNLIQGATVNATVVGCSGSGCSGQTLSDSNGYYVIANLNVEPGGTIRVQASFNDLEGSGETQADQYQAGYLNLTLSTPPTNPTLEDVNDTHTGDVILNWTSGSDPNGLNTSDQLIIDGTVYYPTGNSYRVSLPPGTYKWGVRTCNDYSCSDWVYDTFTVINHPPSPPTLTDQDNTQQLSVALSWESGVDPDGDDVYDEYQFNGGNVISPAISPQYESNLSYFEKYSWRVRTCDKYGACSSWVEDTFITYYCPSGGGGSGGTCPTGVVYISEPSYNIFLEYPNLALLGDVFNVSVTTSSNVELNLSYVLDYSSGLILLGEYSNESEYKATKTITFQANETGLQKISLIVKQKDSTLYFKELNITVLPERETVYVNRTVFVYPPNKPFDWLVLLLVIALLILTLYELYKSKRK